MTSPRPILKRPSGSLDIPHHANHVVHFPPSCSLTCTFTAHSPSAYDRSPIVVTPNSCALPERGCPGRTYDLDDNSDDGEDNRLHHRQHITSPSMYRCANNTLISHARNGRDLHPRALALGVSSSSSSSAASTQSPLFTLPIRKTFNDERRDCNEDQLRTPTLAYPHLPALIPDFSSESEESDSSAYTPTHSPCPDSYSDAALRHFKNLTIVDDTSLSISRPYTPKGASANLNVNVNKYTAYAAYSVSTMTVPYNSPHNSSRVPPPLSFPALSASEDEEYRPPRPRIRRRERSRSRERVKSDTHSDSTAPPISPTSMPSSPKRSSFGSRRGGGGMRLSGGVPRLVSGFSSQEQDSACLGGF